HCLLSSSPSFSLVTYTLRTPLSHTFYLPAFFLIFRRPPISTLFPYTTLFRSGRINVYNILAAIGAAIGLGIEREAIEAGIRQLRSEEHTSELQSPDHIVCRLLLEKKKNEKDEKEMIRISVTVIYI